MAQSRNKNIHREELILMAKKEKKEEIVLEEKKAPEKKGDITPSNMKAYLENHGTPEDKKWFRELCEANKDDSNPKYGIKETIVRNEFIKRFYAGQYEKKTIKKMFWNDISNW